MIGRILKRTAIAGVVYVSLWTSTLSAHPCPTFTTPPAGTPANQRVQEFPPEGPMQTAWKIQFAHATGKGLYITGAWFKTAPAAPWMRILFDVRIADIFVPYHSGSPRYYDLTGFNFPLVNATAADAGACGQIIDGKIIHEVHQRGLLWKDDTAARYGHELVLWATLDSANYNYVMRYAFRDDGTIALRFGATSRNLPGAEDEAHMHNALWRIDMDMNGYSSDSVVVSEHNETTAGPTATDTLVPFNGGIEGFLDWQAEKFTELHVQDSTLNGLGNNISYEFRPLRRGTPRHQETFSHHDFWATRYQSGQTNYSQIASYINGQSVTNSDIVIWHISPAHHLPRDEDGYLTAGSPPVWKGVALLMWGGLDLRPRNLFSSTPLFP